MDNDLNPIKTIWWKLRAKGVWFNIGPTSSRRRLRAIPLQTVVRIMPPFRFQEGLEISPYANVSVYKKVPSGLMDPIRFGEGLFSSHIKRTSE